MCVRTNRASGLAGLLLGVAVSMGPMASGAARDVPTPLVEVAFGDGFGNSGRAGGQARVEVYAQGEGPLLTPGPWGDCLDMTAASRFGGTLQEQTPAGSALLPWLPPANYIPVSVNLQFYRRGPGETFGGAYCVDRLDFLVGEASPGMQSANDYIQPCKVAEAFGVAQVMQCKPATLAPARAALATTYALGQWFRVPWDLYMGNDPTGQPAPRYMGTREDWGRFYDFIHDHPQLFDGYETAAVVGVLFNADEAPYEPVRRICQRLAEQQIAFRWTPSCSTRCGTSLS